MEDGLIAPNPDEKSIYKVRRMMSESVAREIVAQWPKRAMILCSKWYQSVYVRQKIPMPKKPIITILTCRIPHQIGFTILLLLGALPYAGLLKLGSGSLLPGEPLNIELGGLTCSA